MERKGSYVVGIVFVALGVLFLLDNLNIFDFNLNIWSLIGRFWPMFVLIPGLAFHYAFFAGNNKDPGLLVPGGILLVTGITLQLSQLFGAWGVLWPGFIFAVAVGLFELYIFGPRDKGLLIPVGILGGLSVIFFMSFSVRQILGFSATKLVVPLVLILLGISVMTKKR